MALYMASATNLAFVMCAVASIGWVGKYYVVVFSLALEVFPLLFTDGRSVSACVNQAVAGPAVDKGCQPSAHSEYRVY